jgi:hypothetical protein
MLTPQVFLKNSCAITVLKTIENVDHFSDFVLDMDMISSQHVAGLTNGRLGKSSHRSKKGEHEAGTLSYEHILP